MKKVFFTSNHFLDFWLVHSVQRMPISIDFLTGITDAKSFLVPVGVNSSNLLDTNLKKHALLEPLDRSFIWFSPQFRHLDFWRSLFGYSKITTSPRERTFS